MEAQAVTQESRPALALKTRQGGAILSTFGVLIIVGVPLRGPLRGVYKGSIVGSYSRGLNSYQHYS